MINLGDKGINDELKVRGRIIYHYTAVSPLSVFFKPGADLYCTNAKTLNDPVEIIQGALLFADFLHEKKGFGEPHVALMKKNIHESLESDWADMWVMSFSTEGDSLSLWRGYVPDPSGGFAIGFNVARLEKVLSAITRQAWKTSTFPIPRLTRCWYDKRDDELINELFEVQYNRYAASFNKYKNAEKLSNEEVVQVMATVITSVANIKHNAFGDEHEARIVLSVPDALNSLVEILGDKPRMPVCLPATGVKLHTLIDRIVISPHGNINSLMAQAKWLRNKCGGGFEIVQSEIPYDPSR